MLSTVCYKAFCVALLLGFTPISRGMTFKYRLTERYLWFDWTIFMISPKCENTDMEIKMLLLKNAPDLWPLHQLLPTAKNPFSFDLRNLQSSPLNCIASLGYFLPNCWLFLLVKLLNPHTFIHTHTHMHMNTDVLKNWAWNLHVSIICTYYPYQYKTQNTLSHYN